MRSCEECAFSKPTPRVSAGSPAALKTLASEPAAAVHSAAPQPRQRGRLRADGKERAVRLVPVAAERLVHVDLDVDADRGRLGRDGLHHVLGLLGHLDGIMAARLAGTGHSARRRRWQRCPRG